LILTKTFLLINHSILKCVQNRFT